MNLVSRLANVGSEVYRAILWKKKNELPRSKLRGILKESSFPCSTKTERRNKKYSKMAIERALELLNFTISQEKNFYRLKELTRLRECLLDYFFGKNEYRSQDKQWQDYFYSFNYLAQINK